MPVLGVDFFKFFNFLNLFNYWRPLCIWLSVARRLCKARHGLCKAFRLPGMTVPDLAHTLSYLDGQPKSLEIIKKSIACTGTFQLFWRFCGGCAGSDIQNHWKYLKKRTTPEALFNYFDGFSTGVLASVVKAIGIHSKIDRRHRHFPNIRAVS